MTHGIKQNSSVYEFLQATLIRHPLKSVHNVAFMNQKYVRDTFDVEGSRKLGQRVDVHLHKLELAFMFQRCLLKQRHELTTGRTPPTT